MTKSEKEFMSQYIVALILSYAVGATPTAFWVSKFWKGIDIRDVGSGNPGATNVMRAIGPIPAALVFLVDTAKGAVGVSLGGYVSHGIILVAILGGVAAVIGHNWSFWLGFKGGKGVSTTLGVFLALSPIGALIGLVVFIIAVLVTRFVSLGSLLGCLSLAAYVLFTGHRDWLLAFSIVAIIFIFYRHRANIGRLLTGTENKLSFKGRGAGAPDGSPPPNREGPGGFPG